MSVYVDDMEADFGRMKMCHMWSDTYQELIAMAQTIGVETKWLQFPPKASWVHFDIALSKRALAVKAGAIEKTQREAVAWWEVQRQNPTYAVFYPGWLVGYSYGSAGLMRSDWPADRGEEFYAGWAYAWRELGLFPPRDTTPSAYDDDIPF